MIKVKNFYDCLIKHGIDFFTGVPDSLLKDICGYISDATVKEKNIIAANEGGAIGLAIGYNLATSKIPLIYMQNSGLGNAINPLLSLADPDVYSVPMLLLVGWRGEPGVKDEPQHYKQGRINEKLISSMDIPYYILSADLNKSYENIISKSIETAQSNSCPIILLIKKGTFEKYKIKDIVKDKYEMNREDAIKIVISLIDSDDIVISTTGKASREVFEYRKLIGDSHNKDFLTVGGMGHANQIALGISLSKPDKNIYCFDGDGAFLMHSGSMGIIGEQSPSNYKHIIFNNGAHDSVGGQPTIGHEVKITKIAAAFNYKKVFSVSTTIDLKNTFNEFKSSKGPSLLEIMINKGAREDLGRPTISTKENKNNFMNNLGK